VASPEGTREEFSGTLPGRTDGEVVISSVRGDRFVLHPKLKEYSVETAPLNVTAEPIRVLAENSRWVQSGPIETVQLGRYLARHAKLRLELVISDDPPEDLLGSLPILSAELWVDSSLAEFGPSVGRGVVGDIFRIMRPLPVELVQGVVLRQVIQASDSLFEAKIQSLELGQRRVDLAVPPTFRRR
jgi:hypothetical protein